MRNGQSAHHPDRLVRDWEDSGLGLIRRCQGSPPHHLRREGAKQYRQQDLVLNDTSISENMHCVSRIKSSLYSMTGCGEDSVENADDRRAVLGCQLLPRGGYSQEARPPTYHQGIVILRRLLIRHRS